LKIPFATEAYQGRSTPYNGQNLVNLFVEPGINGSKDQYVIYGTPGLSLFGTVGTGVIRGMHEMGGIMYVVSGTELYSVDSSGTGTLRGTIAGSGRVSMADNGTQILIANGTNTLYIYTVAGGLSSVADADRPTADTVVFLDSYFIANNSAQAGQFQITAAYDGTNWDALDFATAEGSPDPLVAVTADHRELWLFGGKTTEVWQNYGDPDFPFQRVALMEKGLLATHAFTSIDNSIFWLGDDRVVHRANQYSPNRISTHAIEEAIRKYTTTSDAFMWSYYDAGHAFVVLTFPTESVTWVYNVAAGKWHEWQTRVAATGQGGRHLSNAHVFVYGKNYVGDYQANGQIYQVDMDTYTDNGEEIQRIATTPAISQDRLRMIWHALEIDFESGVGLISGQGSSPKISLEWSDDGGRTWSNQYFASMGKIGQYLTRARWTRLGQSRQRNFRIQISDPVKVAMYTANAVVEPCSS
jgi:hypothetical protein